MIDPPIKSFSPTPLGYEHRPPLARWSPGAAMVVSGLYGVGLTVAACLCELTFRPFYVTFKVDLPQATEWCFRCSRLVWTDFGWVVLIPALTFIPMALVPLMPVPLSPDRCRTVAWFARIAAVVAFLATAILIGIFMTAPMGGVLTSVSGPQKQ